jgi:hypothetical protein
VAIAQQAEEKRSMAVADSVVTTVYKGGPAVAGLAETLTAVQSGRALHVVAIDGFVQPAYRYVDSGYIVLSLEEANELGSGRIQELPDAVDSIMRRAIGQGISVTILDEHEGLEAIGQVAALTRY